MAQIPLAECRGSRDGRCCMKHFAERVNKSYEELNVKELIVEELIAGNDVFQVDDDDQLLLDEIHQVEIDIQQLLAVERIEDERIQAVYAQIAALDAQIADLG